MLQILRDYWSKRTDIWFEKLIRNNTAHCQNQDSCATDRLSANCWAETVRSGVINAQMQTTYPFRLSTVEPYSLVTPYPSWHRLCISVYRITHISTPFSLPFYCLAFSHLSVLLCVHVVSSNSWWCNGWIRKEFHFKSEIKIRSGQGDIGINRSVGKVEWVRYCVVWN